MSVDTGRLTILHISDVHATDGELLYGEIDGIDRLRHVGEYARDAGVTPEAVIVTGDLAQRGHAGVYPELAGALNDLERVLDAPVLTVIGNHDDPAASLVLPGHGEGHVRSVDLGEFRVILLDSHTGSLGGAQLEWLDAELTETHCGGTVIALHHAPVVSPLPALEKTGLRDSEQLERALRGSDVRAILAGHYHHSMTADVAGIPVLVAPALSYQQIMNAGPENVAGHDHAMFSLVRLTASGVQQSPVMLHTEPALFTIPAPSRL